MLPEIVTEIPGPESLRLAQELKQYECRNVTYTASDWPVFWESASGSNVWDADGNRFLDLTSAFGVAGLGHGWSATAMQEQSQSLLHAMGDVHPTALKVKLCKKLSAVTFERWGEGTGKTTLSNSGFEAVETAMKTARVATGRDGIVTFKNGYHGLGYGALLGGGFDKFRDPFASQLAPHRELLGFPSTPEDLAKLKKQLSSLDCAKIGAVLVEPIQGRGGKVVPPDGFLTHLRAWCDHHGALLIFDEIYTGFNRSGKLFACEHEGTVPDLICLGKAMSGGFPISACVGKSEIMDAWPQSEGEALHTSTFLGNPIGCAMSLQSLEEHTQSATANKVLKKGNTLKKMLGSLRSPLIHEVRGRGLMLGVELRHLTGQPAGEIAGSILSGMLKRGILMLADGPHGNVLAFTPPFDLQEDEMQHAVDQLQCALDQVI